MIGQTISHYKILEKLGEGGMGVVYKAHDMKLDRDVALKFLSATIHPSSEELKRFEQEAKAISALNHANIATIHDVDEYEGQNYLVLEYIPGGTLKGKLRQLKSDDKEFSISEVVDYGIQIAKALAHAHQHGIIHRDVKTENMMLMEDGTAKLTDFGLAKLRGSLKLTKTGSTVGTAAYMSPEQVRGEEVDHQSDIFSFGVMLYELTTSHMPFSGEFEAALSYSIMNDNPPTVHSLRTDVPLSLEHIIIRCLEKDKSKRFQNVDEITSELRTIQQEISGASQIKGSRSRIPWIIAAAAVVLAALGFYIFYARLPSTLANRKSIAVLPFKNLSDSKEDEYFSDGITEDIITQLSKISDMKVISRTAVMKYKQSDKGPKEIGRELDVATVMEGSVRRAGNQVRIVAQLIDAQNEGHVWAETYDKEMTEIFAIQSDVAQRIAASLKARLLPEEKERIDKRPTENTEAYQLCLKGRYYWNKRTGSDLKTAIDYFHQAIGKDSNYALAYAGLASAYVILPEYSGLPAKSVLPPAKNAARKASELDPSLAEPHAVLGVIAADYEWDWAIAEREYKRAIELDPKYPTAHHWYNILLRNIGRLDEALAEVKRAQELDPLSRIINVNLADVIYIMRQYDKAIDQYKKTIELDSYYAGAHEPLGAVYMAQGKYTDAIAEFEKVRSIVGNHPYGLSMLGYAYARSRERSKALAILDELNDYRKRGYAVSFDIAIMHYGLENRDAMFEWFDKAFQEDDIRLGRMKTEPLWDGIRSDPRFIHLLKRVGLEK